MALGVIHHYLYQATEERRGTGKPVLLIVPASLLDMWIGELERYNLDWACHVLTVQRLREGVDLTKFVGADLVVIDEAHRLRGGGRWFQETMRIMSEGAADKRILMLTATPIHTSLKDLTNLLRIMTKNRRAAWAPAIADFERYLARVEKREVDPFPLLDRAVVRRSRSDLIRAYEEQTKAGLIVERPSLPERKLMHVQYQYMKGGSDDLFTRFVGTIKELRLAPYDLERFRLGALEDGSPAPPSSLVGLYVAGLLKRFESSLRAVHVSLDRLETLLRRFLTAMSTSPPRVFDLSSDPRLRKLIEQEAGEDDEERDGEDLELAWTQVLDSLPELGDPDTYDLDLIKEATTDDLKAIVALINSLPPEDGDGKIEALRGLLMKRPLADHEKRVLIFTQYADTAIYVAERLTAMPEVGPVALIHGAVSAEARREITAWFDPARGAHAVEYRLAGAEEPRILVSTDVLAEGHNLQLAQAAVNFDLHWNPQVAVQRSGRIDRLNSPHPSVHLISFLPDEGIDAHLNLIHALDERFGLIHQMGLGDEPVTTLESDIQTVTFEQLRKLYADDPNVLDEVERAFTLGSTDFMRAPLEQFLMDAGEAVLREIPVGVQSARTAPAEWKHGEGVFLAFKFEEQTIWRFYPKSDDMWGAPITDELVLFQAIACPRAEPRAEVLEAPPGPGGVIEWDLLWRAAREVADEITTYRATADIARGASERSRRLRQDLRQVAAAAEYASENLALLLDRLEQVRVEDYDARPGWNAFDERVRRAKRSQQVAERRQQVEDATSRGLELFGLPEAEESAVAIEVDPAKLALVSWEWLVPEALVPADQPPEQVTLA